MSKPTQCRAPVALLRSVRLAIDTGDIALAAMVVENAQERRAESLGSIMQGITLVFGNLPLSESIEGRKLALQLRVPFSPKKHSSFCTCSVRVLCEFGSERGANHRSKEDRAAIPTSKMGNATVMLRP